MNSMYNLVYIITNILGTYTILKFMNVFFDRKEADKKIEILSYAAYFIIITSMYYFVNIPVIMMICNLIAFMGLSFNYKSDMKKRILSIFLIYIILMCIEMTIALMSGYFNFSILSVNDYSSEYGLIAVKLLSYAVSLILNNHKNIKNGEIVPNLSWVCIVLMPVSSLYIILMIFQAQGLSQIQVTISIVLTLTINFTAFYLYDAIIESLSEKTERLLLEQQNKYYDSQFNLMKESVSSTSELRHDLKNHMSAIYMLAENDEKEQLLMHVSEIIKVCSNQRQYSHSGNIIIDSIVNFRIQEAEQKNIKLRFSIIVPEKIEIPSFDMTVILGNLLDNAIRAASGLKENRYINIIIKYDRGRLIIKIDNPYEGEILKENNSLLTTRYDKKNHGIGLKNVTKVLQKYNGYMKIDHENNIFSVMLLMYIE